jgi:protein phosphatase 1D
MSLLPQIITIYFKLFTGDLWSYNYLKEEFVVSPEPDVSVHKLDPATDKCLVIGSDGLWNMLTAEESVSSVFDLECQFEYKVINDPVS